MKFRFLAPIFLSGLLGSAVGGEQPVEKVLRMHRAGLSLRIEAPERRRYGLSPRSGNEESGRKDQRSAGLTFSTGCEGPRFNESRVEAAWPSGRFQGHAIPARWTGADSGVQLLREGLNIEFVSPQAVQSRRRALSFDGGGADAEGLLAVQSRFRDAGCILPAACETGPCNAVDLSWRETTENALGLELFIDDVSVAILTSAPGGSFPRTSAISISPIATGFHTYRIREVVPEGTPTPMGTSTSIAILDGQPFLDARSPICEERDNTADGRCTLTLSVENPVPPELYGVFLDGAFVGTADPAAGALTFPGLAPGQYVIALFGSLTNASGTYQSCPVEFPCTVLCERTAPCQPPVSPTAYQVTYGSQGGGNNIELAWINGEPFYAGGIQVFLSGALRAEFPPGPNAGNPSLARLTNLPAATVELGVLGVCSPGEGTSELAETSFPIRTETPHTRPVIPGSVSCTWSPENGGRTEMTWSTDDPSAIILPSVLVGDTEVALPFFGGTVGGYTVTGTTATMPVVLRFVGRFDGALYASEPVVCSPTNLPRFLRSLCDGRAFVAEGAAPVGGARPDISSATFLLNFLFLGGPAPVCRVACDANFDGVVDVADGTFTLNFLFLGGPGPSGWPTGPNGEANPACEIAGPEDDCDQAHDVCDESL